MFLLLLELPTGEILEVVIEEKTMRLLEKGDVVKVNSNNFLGAVFSPGSKEIFFGEYELESTPYVDSSAKATYLAEGRLYISLSKNKNESEDSFFLCQKKFIS